MNMRKRDLLAQQKRDYIQTQFSKEESEFHFLKFSKDGEIFFSTGDGCVKEVILQSFYYPMSIGIMWSANYSSF